LPLAVELAAARVRQLEPSELADRLSERFAVLTEGPRDHPTRHQTLRATIEWSHDLLDEDERDGFAALGVFAGGWTAENADVVCGVPAEALDGLADRSLLRRDGTWYSMLETIREYAVERLEARSDADELRRRHAVRFAALAEEAAAALWDPVQGPSRVEWLDRLEAEYGNLRAALAWAAESDRELELRLAVGLFEFWLSRSHYEEGLGWFERALRNGAAADEALRARALHSAAFLSFELGDFDRGFAWAEESLALYRSLDDPVGIGRTVHVLSQAASSLGQRGRALAYAEESLRLARELGHVRGLIVSLRDMAALTAEDGDDNRAATMFEEAERLARQHRDDSALADVLLLRSRLSLKAGDFEEAAGLAAACVPLYRAHGTTVGIAWAVLLLALAAEADGRPERAVRLFGAAEALRETVGTHVLGADEDVLDAALGRAQDALGVAEFEAGLAEGRALSVDELVTLALADDATSSVA
jgi:tetratricopeptide (TPR) repeat protein